jgi:DNA polymerase, archaea type
LNHLLYGRDDTPGIVSVKATKTGRAAVWRRVNGQVILERETFPNWVFIHDLSLLATANCERLDPEVIGKIAQVGKKVGVIELAGDLYFKYLVITDNLEDLEDRLLEGYNTDRDIPVTSIGKLRDEMYARPAVEQYLTWTGRTYYKAMNPEDVVRFQFDLETTGLDPRTSKLFMISMKDSRGFERVIDVGDFTEKGLLEELARVVRELDPDIIENHNIFDFDIPFVVERAGANAIELRMGRDGRGFGRHQDSLKIGEDSENFTRWTLGGREIVDTLHAVRRYNAIARDLRARGLKQSARHFGLATEEREYVPGPEIWKTFQGDPDRIRRYALDDVREVDGLSKLLLSTSFSLSTMVPKAYERVATSGTGQGLIEPLMVRAYLHAGYSLPNVQANYETYEGAYTELFNTGIFKHVVKADVASLYPSVMLVYRVEPRTDRLSAFLSILRELTELRLSLKSQLKTVEDSKRQGIDAQQSALKILINSFYGSLGAKYTLFGDAEKAAEVTRRGREILGQMLEELRAHEEVTLIEADTDGVLFACPEMWTQGNEIDFIKEISASLPEGINVDHDGRFERMYSHATKNYVLLGYDGKIKIVGVAFRSPRSEPYGERFLTEAWPYILREDHARLRELYLDVVYRLWMRGVPASDLCVEMPLTKTPKEYEYAGRREEVYEVVLRAGWKEWKPNRRVRYYRTLSGEKCLLDHYCGDYDPAFYVKKLRETYLKRFREALTPEIMEEIFPEIGTLQPTLF